MKTVLRILLVVALVVVVPFFSSCTTGSPNFAVATSRYIPTDLGEVSGADERPGLGTTLGSERHQNLRKVTFFRKGKSPDGVATFYYNDEEGAKSMASLAGKPRKRSGDFDLLDGKVEASLNYPRWRGKGDEYDRYEAGGKVFVIGEHGHEYCIALENKTNVRAEYVVSVDGRDVLSGASASMTKRGYVVEPGKEIVIRGLRLNGKIRSFKFAGVDDSYANQTGGEAAARNVGVVGVAVFYEDVAARKRAMTSEGMERDDADAFPQS